MINRQSCRKNRRDYYLENKQLRRDARIAGRSTVNGRIIYTAAGSICLGIKAYPASPKDTSTNSLSRFADKLLTEKLLSLYNIRHDHEFCGAGG